MAPMASKAGSLTSALALLLVAAGHVSAGEADIATLRLEDQQTTGRSLLVAAVSVARPAWIVVHAIKSQSGDIESRILGHLPVGPGKSTGVDVPLDAPVEAGQVLLVLLHEDNGIAGTFEFSADNGFVDDLLLIEGAPVGAFVTAQGDSAAEARR